MFDTNRFLLIHMGFAWQLRLFPVRFFGPHNMATFIACLGQQLAPDGSVPRRIWDEAKLYEKPMEFSEGFTKISYDWSTYPISFRFR